MADTDTDVADTDTDAADTDTEVVAHTQDVELTAAPIAAERLQQPAVMRVAQLGADMAAEHRRPAVDLAAAEAASMVEAAVAPTAVVADTGNRSNSAATPRSPRSSSTKPVCFGRRALRLRKSSSPHPNVLIFSHPLSSRASGASRRTCVFGISLRLRQSHQQICNPLGGIRMRLRPRCCSHARQPFRVGE